MLNKTVNPMSRWQFLQRFIKNFILGAIIIIFSLLLGMLGYHHFENLSLVDSFVNASMILSGMGPVSNLQTNAGKIFAGFYALFSGIVFLVIIAIVFAPVVHRFLHKFHFGE